MVTKYKVGDYVEGIEQNKAGVIKYIKQSEYGTTYKVELDSPTGHNFDGDGLGACRAYGVKPGHGWNMTDRTIKRLIRPASNNKIIIDFFEVI